ncbi:FtsH protease activity modulator HflK [Pararhodospirillum photometricum]|uniref:Protein HflK n=1 Tax=Pararhodospirillum photometricum DSM 122 TaxID=1150469 RepID=H6SIH9_PARPM|nr:FtsH protease activity modulator HflK [Pararhodospirillum photometricum]CCG06745.1 HflK [Pararhodospirillum photometricum DSM 122]
MGWNQQGGGPWGGGSGGGGGPWGSGNGRGFGGGGPGSQPPDLEDVLRRGQDRLRRLLPGGGGLGGKSLALVLMLGLGLWLLTGFYRVSTDEQGVVLRFGEFTHTTPPGLHYHLPYPIETVLLPKVTRENRVELGFRGQGDGRGRTVPRDVLEESLMLTGDENIIDIDFSVVWVIKDAGAYLFNLRDPAGAVGWAAESAMREVIGQTRIQVALTEGRQSIEDRTKELLQALLDEYKAGIQVRRVQLLKVDPPSQVVDAFNDVQRARADRERLSNEADAYRNAIIPEARGQAERLLQEAEAYKEEIVNRAQGDASRFTAVYQAYKADREVTTRRLYLETMEEVLAGANKVLVDKASAGVIPYLPLPQLQAQQGATKAPAPGGNR